MREVVVPEKIDHESSAGLAGVSFGIKDIFRLFGSGFLALILGMLVYEKIRFIFYIFFVGTCFYMLMPSTHIYGKKNWQAYLLVLLRDHNIYH